MTAICYPNKRRKTADTLISCICIIVFIIALYNGGALREGAIHGLKICAFNIIPTLFPFFILSDLCSSAIYFSERSPISILLKKLFNISSEGILPLIMGNMCGLPLGAKIASEKWKDNLITDEEINYLSALCNNPSPAFVISGVGAGLLGDIKAGFLLYFSTIMSTCMIGFIFKSKNQICYNQSENIRQKFDLINSIKSAGYSSITVSSYVIFFSSVIGLFKIFLNNDVIIALMSSFFEIGSACNIIADSKNALGIFYLPMLSFAISFSGLSAFLQILSILPPVVSKKKYLLKKTIQALVSAAITYILINM